MPRIAHVLRVTHDNRLGGDNTATIDVMFTGATSPSNRKSSSVHAVAHRETLLDITVFVSQQYLSAKKQYYFSQS